jgi:sRNA-binding carbon storage regulator CsrA
VLIILIDLNKELMTSNLKEKAVTYDSVQVSEQEILKHLADSIKFNFKAPKHTPIPRSETASVVNT